MQIKKITQKDIEESKKADIRKLFRERVNLKRQVQYMGMTKHSISNGRRNTVAESQLGAVKSRLCKVEKLITARKLIERGVFA